jgi:hypothetical protein
MGTTLSLIFNARRQMRKRKKSPDDQMTKMKYDSVRTTAAEQRTQKKQMMPVHAGHGSQANL